MNTSISAFNAFLKVPITLDYIDVLSRKARLVANAHQPISHKKKLISPPQTPSDLLPNSPHSLSPTPSPNLSTDAPNLRNFIKNLIVRSRVQPSTLFGTLVYLERLRTRGVCVPNDRGLGPHRAFLASLILAGKYLNDSSPKNKHWSTYSTIFNLHEVNKLEGNMLAWLEFCLDITLPDLLVEFETFQIFTTPQPSANIPYSLPLKSPLEDRFPPISHSQLPPLKTSRQHAVVPLLRSHNLPAPSTSSLLHRRASSRKSALLVPSLNLNSSSLQLNHIGTTAATPRSGIFPNYAPHYSLGYDGHPMVNFPSSATLPTQMGWSSSLGPILDSHANSNVTLTTPTQLPKISLPPTSVFYNAYPNGMPSAPLPRIQ